MSLRKVPIDRPESPDVERARLVAWNARMDYAWHEVAIDSVFKIEDVIHKLMDEILDALGPPESIQMWEVVNDEEVKRPPSEDRGR